MVGKLLYYLLYSALSILPDVLSSGQYLYISTQVLEAKYSSTYAQVLEYRYVSTGGFIQPSRSSFPK